MTGEVTARFNGITLFGIDLVWQKSNDFFTSFIIHFLTDRVERLFNSDWAEYGLLGHRSMRGPTDRWPRIADGCSIDLSGYVNSVNKSSRIKHLYSSQTGRYKKCCRPANEVIQ